MIFALNAHSLSDTPDEQSIPFARSGVITTYRQTIPRSPLVLRACVPRFPARGLAALVLLLLSSVALQAESPVDLDSLSRYATRNWTREDGLPMYAVGPVAQTKDGYVWAGTEEGLVRFDGSRFTVFDAESSPALRSSAVVSLATGGDGALWIGTRSGLSSWVRGAFRSHENSGLPQARVNAVLASRSGAIWAGTARGLFLSRDSKSFVSPAGGGLDGAEISALAEDRAGRVWVGTNGGGLHRCDGKSCERVSAASATIRSLEPAGDSAIWVGTKEAGLFRIEGDRVQHWSKEKGLPNDSIYALLESSDGSLWVGTNGGGISRFRGGRFENLGTERGPGLIRSLIEDRDGNIWAAAEDAGLTRLRRVQFAVLGTEDGLSSDVILATHQAPNGDLWVGTAGNGVNRFHEDRWLRYDSTNGLKNDLVLTIYGDSRGSIWIGTAGGGLTEFRDEQFRHFGRKEGLASRIVTAVLPSRDGSLWVGTNSAGLHRLSGGRIQQVKGPGATAHIISLLESSDGTLWIVTDGFGVSRLSTDGVMLPEVKGFGGTDIQTLFEDARGAIWIGARSGLSRFHDGKLATITTNHGLHENHVQQILEDGRGFLWLGGNRGITRVSLDDAHAVADGRAARLTVETFGTRDGLRTEETNGGVFPAGWKSREGLLYFPTMKGLAVTDASLVSRSTHLVPVIERVRTESLDVVSPAAREIHLPPRTRRLEITFTAPNFVDPDATVYRYKLEGFDSEWVDAESRQVAQYTRIPPGRYTFRVAARNGSAGWSEAEAETRFEVAAAFYETKAFLVLVVSLLLLLAFLIHHALTRALRRRHAALERVIVERAEAEALLRRSENHFRRLIENASDLVMIVSATGTISYVSPSAPRVLGKTAEEMIGQDVRSLVRAEDAAVLEETFFRNLKHDETATALVQVPSQTSPDHYLELVGQRLEFKEGSDQLLINCRDITQRKTLERRLEQANRIASLGRLAATVAHEFNNVLMAVRSMAEAIRRNPAATERNAQLVPKIMEAVDRGKRITEGILRFTRDAEPVIVPVEVRSWAANLESELQGMLRNDIRLRMTLPENDLTVAADAQQLTQLFTNLALNAEDAMGEGGTLDIRFYEAEEDELRALGFTSGSYLHIEVEDYGEGITPDVLPHIFEPLYTTKRTHGTGLGLAVAHQIVERHGGYMAAASEPGKGTTFHILLPLAAAAFRAELPGQLEGERADGLEILLVEDDPLVSEGLVINLEDRGAAVRVVSRGRDVIAALEDRQPDVVILDVGLPDIPGTTVFEEIASRFPLLPVVFSTGHAEESELDGYLLRADVESIRKPYRIGDLLKKLHLVIKSRRQSAGAAR